MGTMKSSLNGSAFAIASLLALSIVTACAPKSNEHLPDDSIHETAQTALVPTNDPALPVAANDNEPKAPAPTTPAPAATAFAKLDPSGIVPKPLLRQALAYYVAHKNEIPNKNVLSVIDFSQPSNRRRFFIINMQSGSVWALPVAHGRGSDINQDGFAERFSNAPESHASALGVYRTAEIYSGAHGLSLRLDGLSATNSNARARDIVIHGADYVQERDVIQGRSWGCPAVPSNERTKVINALKGGSIIFAGRALNP